MVTWFNHRNKAEQPQTKLECGLTLEEAREKSQESFKAALAEAQARQQEMAFLDIDIYMDDGAQITTVQTFCPAVYKDPSAGSEYLGAGIQLPLGYKVVSAREQAEEAQRKFQMPTDLFFRAGDTLLPVTRIRRIELSVREQETAE
jgi:hypothetical protein